MTEAYDIQIGVSVVEETDGKVTLRVAGKKLIVTKKGLFKAIALGCDEASSYDMGINTESLYEGLAEDLEIGEEDL